MERGTFKGCASDSAPAASKGPLRLQLPIRFSLALVLPLLIGLLLSTALFFVIRGWELRARQDELTHLAQERVEILQSKMAGSLEVLQSVARFYSATAPLTRSGFDRFTAETQARHPELQGLSWDPIVPAALRAKFEEEARRDGFAQFQFSEMDREGHLIPAGPREEYVPVYFEQPLRNNEAALGFDLASNPERQNALITARNTGLPAATRPLRLVQETENQMGFLVLMPIYRGPKGTLEERRKNLAGFASAVFRIADLVESSLNPPPKNELNVVIEDLNHGRLRILELGESAARHAEGASEAAGFNPSELLQSAGVAWKITFRPTDAYLANRPLRQCWAALGAGLIISLLLAAYMHRELRRTAEIEQRVAERTQELSTEVVERLRAEDALRKAEKKYRSIFEHSIEGIFQTTPDGHYISANPALARIYGYSSAEELMADLDDIGAKLYVEPRRRADFMRSVQAEGAVSDFESQVRRKDGTIIWIAEKARAVSDDQGEVLYYEGSVEEITSRKLADEALRRDHHDLELRVQERTSELARSNEALQAEIVERKRAEAAAEAASRAKSTFLAHMSHEIRTPLNAILGYAQILQRHSHISADQRRAIDTIASSSNHLFGLIDDILDISKIEAGRMELEPTYFNLGNLVFRLESMFQHRCQQKRIALKVEQSIPQPCWRNADEGKLRQVLINLLGNAVKFTHSGEIRLKLQSLEGDLVRIEVADTGIGIASEEQALVLEAFQQAAGGLRKGGTGLGLAISQNYVRLMGGELKFDSQLGKGSRFYFSIPLPAALTVGPAAVGAGPGHRLAPGSQVRAMVVDDIDPNRRVLTDALTNLGCEVFTACDGEQALQLARTQPLDIIFMDIWMPGMNGIDATQRIISEHGSKIKLVAHSASAFDHEQRRYLDAGFDDFFAKPFRFDRLCACLSSLLGVAFTLDAPTEPPALPTPPIPATAFPEPFATRLRLAAELYSVTELKTCLKELGGLGTEGEQLAAFLRPFVERFDMNAILHFLGQPQPVSASAPI